MVGKIFKYLMCTVAGVLLAAGMVAALLYLPPVQRYLKERAVASLSASMGVDVSVGGFRVRFPLSVELDGVAVVAPGADTVLYAGRLSAGVRLLPLATGSVHMGHLEMESVRVDYVDTLSAMEIRGRLDALRVADARVGLARGRVYIPDVALRGADIYLGLGGSMEEDAAAPDSVKWVIGVGCVTLDSVRFNMRMVPDTMLVAADLGHGRLEHVRLDMAARDVSAGRIALERGSYEVFMEAGAAGGKADGAAPAPWTVNAGSVAIEDNSLVFARLGGKRPAKGFDPDYIALSGIDMKIDSLHSRSADVAARIGSLSFRERSGLSVRDGDGGFRMDGTGIVLSGLRLATANSSVEADLCASPGITAMDPAARLRGSVKAKIGMRDLFMLVPADGNVQKILGGESIAVSGNVDGTLGDLRIGALEIGMPGYVDLGASGYVRSAADPAKMSADVTFKGALTDLERLKAIIPDSATRNAFSIPGTIGIDGALKADKGTYSPWMTVTVDTGRLAVAANVNPAAESYSARVGMRDFPLYKFLPHDTSGLVTLGLSVGGRGFDPRGDGAEARLRLRVDGLDYRRHTYRDISFAAELADHRVKGSLASGDPSAAAEMDLSGELYPGRYGAEIGGRIRNVDLEALGFADSTIRFSAAFDARAEMGADSTLRAGVRIDSLRVVRPGASDLIPLTTFRVEALTESVDAVFVTGDMALDLRARTSLGALAAAAHRIGETVGGEIGRGWIDMSSVGELVPDFHLDIRAGRNNYVRQLTRGYGFDFDGFYMTAMADDYVPVNASVNIMGLRTRSLRLDTLQLGAYRRDRALGIYLRMANRPGNALSEMALIEIEGEAAADSLHVDFLQRNVKKETGFEFTLGATLRERLLTVGMHTLNPTLGYEKWSVNPGNYITYNMDNRNLFADVGMKQGRQQVLVQSNRGEDLAEGRRGHRTVEGAVKVYASGLVLEKALHIMPSPLPITGIFQTDILLALRENFVLAAGSLGVDSMYYDRRRVGDVSARLGFVADSVGNLRMGTSVELDRQRVFTASGIYPPSGDMNFTVRIPSLPMRAVDPFVPNAMAAMGGEMTAEVRMRRDGGKLSLTGGAKFRDGSVTLPMTATTLRLSEDSVTLADGKLNLNGLSLIAPNKGRMTLSGSVEVGGPDRIYADLALRARNFQAINSSRGRNNNIYGKLELDADVTVKGSMDNLKVRGGVNVLSSTDVVYTMADPPLSVEDRRQTIVRFASFAEEDRTEDDFPVRETEPWTTDMLVNIDIGDKASATVNMDNAGNNRIELVGGGNLAYTMNNRGDTRLTGRYALSGGTVVYNPPVIPQKSFRIGGDSYVEWTGEMLDPAFNIAATERVRTVVTDANGVSRNVNFDIAVNVMNTLEDMEIVFDLSAPDDLIIQNELQSLTREQRSAQAMAMLIYNTYTGPGSQAKIDAGNPLGSFIEKELNQWARNNLRGVDLSFGIDSYDDMGGGQHTDYSYRVSKNLFDDRVKVAVGGSVSTGTSASDNMKENFVDDISVEYKITERDNMFVKFYRYNTRESIFEGEVVETGTGLVVRKKTGRLGELFRLTRSRKGRAAEKTAGDTP